MSAAQNSTEWALHFSLPQCQRACFIVIRGHNLTSAGHFLPSEIGMVNEPALSAKTRIPKAAMLLFAYPWLLLLLPLAGLIGWWRWRARRPALRFSDTRLLAGLPAGRGRAARWIDCLLHAGAALALLLALAGPRWPLPTPIT